MPCKWNPLYACINDTTISRNINENHKKKNPIATATTKLCTFAPSSVGYLISFTGLMEYYFRKKKFWTIFNSVYGSSKTRNWCQMHVEINAEHYLK